MQTINTGLDANTDTGTNTDTNANTWASSIPLTSTSLRRGNKQSKQSMLGNTLSCILNIYKLQTATILCYCHKLLIPSLDVIHAELTFHMSPIELDAQNGINMLQLTSTCISLHCHIHVLVFLSTRLIFILFM